MRQRPFGAGEFGEGEVEQLDADPGLADVDADHVAAGGRDPQQGAGAAAVGLDGAGLLDAAVVDQFGDDVADGAELSPVAGPSSWRLSGPSKYSRCSTAARLPRRRSRTVRPLRSAMWLPSDAASTCKIPLRRPLDATFLHDLNHAIN